MYQASNKVETLSSTLEGCLRIYVHQHAVPAMKTSGPSIPSHSDECLGAYALMPSFSPTSLDSTVMNHASPNTELFPVTIQDCLKKRVHQHPVPTPQQATSSTSSIHFNSSQNPYLCACTFSARSSRTDSVASVRTWPH